MLLEQMLDQIEAQREDRHEREILVMGIDLSTGLPYSIKGMELEQHEEGGCTLWIKMEEM